MMLSRRAFRSAQICAELAAPELAQRVDVSLVLTVLSLALRQAPWALIAARTQRLYSYDVAAPCERGLYFRIQCGCARQSLTDHS